MSELYEDRIASTKLLDAVIVTGASSGLAPARKNRTFQAYGSTSAATGAATIKIQVNNEAADAATAKWIDLATITLTLGTTITTDGFASDASWRFVRANVTAISGTDAAVTVLMGF